MLLLKDNSATMVTIRREIQQGSECSRTSIAALRCSIESIASRAEDPQAWARMATKCFDSRPSTKMVRRPPFLREKQLAFVMGTHAKLQKIGCVIPADSFEEGLLMKIVELSEDRLSLMEMRSLIHNYAALSTPVDEDEKTMTLRARLVSARKVWDMAVQWLGW